MAGLELGARDLGSWLRGIKTGIPTIPAHASNFQLYDVGFFPDFLAKKTKDYTKDGF